MSRKVKMPTRPYTRQMYGIQNPYGEIWTSSTFESIAEAKQYVRDFWLGQKGERDLEKFNVIPVTVTITGRS